MRHNTRTILLAVFISGLLFGVEPALAQAGLAVSIRNGLTNPATCAPSGTNIFVHRTSSTAADAMRLCTAANTWSDLVISGGSGGWPLLAPNGSAAAPSYAFANSATTGLFRSAANAIGFATNGVERWTMSASGGWNCTVDGGCDIGNGAADPRDITITRNFKTRGGYVDLSTGSMAIEMANEAVTGTTTNKLAKLTGAPSTATLAVTTDTTGIVGVCISGCANTGTAVIARAGEASCVFDGATTAGDYVAISSTVNGDCHDTGAATYPTSGQVLGRVLSTNGGGGTYAMTLHMGTQAGSGATGTGTLNFIPRVTNATGPVYGDSALSDDGTKVLITSRTLSDPGAGTNSERFGAGSTAAGGSSAVFGNGASAAGAGGVAMGINAAAGTTQSIAIGNGASVATNVNGIAIGLTASATGSGIAIGPTASSTGSSALAIGPGSSASASSSIAIGTNAASATTGRAVIGGTSNSITSLLIGNGETNASPPAITITGTGGSGSNVAGANITYDAPNGTGTGGSGSHIFRTAPVAGSSSTANTYATRLTIPKTGQVTANGGLAVPVITTAKTADYTAGANDYFIPVDINGASGNVTITLSSTNAVAGQIYVIKCTSTHATRTVILSPSSGNIDGGASVTMNPVTIKEAATVIYDGTNWYVTAVYDSAL